MMYSHAQARPRLALEIHTLTHALTPASSVARLESEEDHRRRMFEAEMGAEKQPDKVRQAQQRKLHEMANEPVRFHSACPNRK